MVPSDTDTWNIRSMDILTVDQRSRNMARIQGRNTKPEMRVRSLLHRLGYRFRLHRAKLPGSPDIVLPCHRAVIFVHGCFWHRHAGCRGASNPKTRPEFWGAKFEANVRRDRNAVEALEGLGWRVLVLWECESKDVIVVAKAIQDFLGKETAIDEERAKHGD